MRTLTCASIEIVCFQMPCTSATTYLHCTVKTAQDFNSKFVYSYFILYYRNSKIPKIPFDAVLIR